MSATDGAVALALAVTAEAGSEVPTLLREAIAAVTEAMVAEATAEEVTAVEEEVIDAATITGGCHCGVVRFEADVAAQVELLDCNCSICAKTGFLHLIVPHEQFRLTAGHGSLTSYRFGTGAAEHLFCAACGIKSFYQPRSHPRAWSINWRAVDEGHGVTATTCSFDGRNWDAARDALDK